MFFFISSSRSIDNFPYKCAPGCRVIDSMGGIDLFSGSCDRMHPSRYFSFLSLPSPPSLIPRLSSPLSCPSPNLPLLLAPPFLSPPLPPSLFPRNWSRQMSNDGASCLSLCLSHHFTLYFFLIIFPHLYLTSFHFIFFSSSSDLSLPPYHSRKCK